MLGHVFTMMHNTYMHKDGAITIRVPSALKKKLETRAAQQHRSLSAQVVADLERVVDSSSAGNSTGSFLGLYKGTRLPSEDDLDEVRSLLWGDIRGLEHRG